MCGNIVLWLYNCVYVLVYVGTWVFGCVEVLVCGCVGVCGVDVYRCVSVSVWVCVCKCVVVWVSWCMCLNLDV